MTAGLLWERNPIEKIFIEYISAFHNLLFYKGDNAKPLSRKEALQFVVLMALVLSLLLMHP